MKCEECGGTGKVQKWFYERTGFGKCEKVCGDVKCEWCNGTGEVEQTNEEYLQSCDTEQLAETIHKMLDGGLCDVCRYDCRERCVVHGEEDEIKVIKEWLKQPHTKE